METSFRVPTMGGRNMKTRRKSPPESPEIEAIQYNCPLVNWKPMRFSMGAMADTRYHVANAKNRIAVVMIKVCQAIFLSQFSGVSGSQP